MIFIAQLARVQSYESFVSKISTSANTLHAWYSAFDDLYSFRLVLVILLAYVLSNANLIISPSHYLWTAFVGFRMFFSCLGS
jgi:hypothetical protein